MRLVSALILVTSLASCVQKAPTISIVPKPVSLQTTGEIVQLGDALRIIAPSPDEAGRLVSFLEEKLRAKGIATDATADKSITLQLVQYDTLVPEGFHKLTVKTSGIQIESNSPVGLFYGIQTLLQLLPEKDTPEKMTSVDIIDYPRFPYRGLHLDVGRHFFPASFVKQYIDWLAFHKFNYFHWHLTEDQGWRMEVRKYPRLQEIASQRKETLVGHAGTPEVFDGQPYGGFYTQEEIKDIVTYASERFVTIIPEIEMPGHSLAALAAYPTLGCTGGPYEVATKWGVFPDVFCAGKEETFEFLKYVLDEVIELFPGPYVHIGGDECPKVRWKSCPNCQRRIKSMGLADEHELQSYFIQRIEKYLNGKGRKLIGWDEILEGGLAPNATVMSWRGEAGGITAAKENHEVIMTPGNWCYFDHYQDSSKSEPLAIGGFTPVSEVYSYEPVPGGLSPAEAKYILGAQGNMWSEYITTPEHAAYMVYPRACALAEVVWSPKQARNYDDFLQRMSVHLKRLDNLGIPFAPHIVKELNP